MQLARVICFTTSVLVDFLARRSLFPNIVNGTCRTLLSQSQTQLEIKQLSLFTRYSLISRPPTAVKEVKLEELLKVASHPIAHQCVYSLIHVLLNQLGVLFFKQIHYVYQIFGYLNLNYPTPRLLLKLVYNLYSYPFQISIFYAFKVFTYPNKIIFSCPKRL